MKKLFTFLIGLAISATSYAQAVPNGGFETASGTSADGWNQTGGKVEILKELQVTQNGENKLVTAAHGANALQVTNTTQVGVATTNAFAISSRPKTLRMAAIYLPRQNGEGFGARVIMSKWNADSSRTDTLYAVTLGVPQLLFPWTNITFPIQDTGWKSTETPDTATIVLIAGAYQTRIQNTLLWVDNVVFSEFATSAKDYEVNTLSKASVYPSPATANSISTLTYTIHTNTNVQIDLYDIQGKLVKNVVNEEQTYGEKELEVSLGDLTPGVYFYNIKTGQSTKSVKFIVE